jgi:hypothetical protein
MWSDRTVSSNLYIELEKYTQQPELTRAVQLFGHVTYWSQEVPINPARQSHLPAWQEPWLLHKFGHSSC